jgi:hypothetical protein
MNDGRGGRVLDGDSVGTVRRGELECTVRPVFVVSASGRPVGLGRDGGARG